MVDVADHRVLGGGDRDHIGETLDIADEAGYAEQSCGSDMEDA